MKSRPYPGPPDPADRLPRERNRLFAFLASVLLTPFLLAFPAGADPATDEASIEKLIHAFGGADADAIHQALRGLTSDTLQLQMSDAGLRGLASRIAEWKGFEATGLDTDGTHWTISGRTGDGMGVRLVLTFEQGRISQMRMRLGEVGESSRLPSLEFPAEPTGEAATETLQVTASVLDRFFEQLGPFSGTVLVAVDGEPIYRHASGLASRRFEVPNRIDTRFDLGSINKLFTKLAIARLVQEGRLSLDHTLDRWLPDFPDPENAKKITIDHLVHHRSGLGDIFNERYEQVAKDRLRRPKDYYPLFAGQPLLFEPGSGRRYSNVGYQVLGAVIEAVTGESYHDVIREQVFEPAGMASTGFFAADQPVPNVAIGYTSHGAPDGEVRNNLFLLPVIGSPAGSSFSTVDDLLRFDRALREHRLADAEHSEWVLGGPEPGSGAEPSAPPSRAGIGVAGGAPGVSAVLESNGRLTVIALSNFDEPGAADIGSHLFRQLQPRFGE